MADDTLAVAPVHKASKFAAFCAGLEAMVADITPEAELLIPERYKPYLEAARILSVGVEEITQREAAPPVSQKPADPLPDDPNRDAVISAHAVAQSEMLNKQPT